MTMSHFSSPEPENSVGQPIGKVLAGLPLTSYLILLPFVGNRAACKAQMTAKEG